MNYRVLKIKLKFTLRIFKRIKVIFILFNIFLKISKDSMKQY